ncbi:MAG: M10 family metallopeptidase C-terminal domain-containing protein [Candidatus Omnitrophica bacterium]|nr:M10 family metallopeptidase C-terminal domain-containing protein [Candidatus Omnitrophota bacterium]
MLLITGTNIEYVRTQPGNNKFDLEALEPRVLLSADGTAGLLAQNLPPGSSPSPSDATEVIIAEIATPEQDWAADDSKVASRVSDIFQGVIPEPMSAPAKETGQSEDRLEQEQPLEEEPGKPNPTDSPAENERGIFIGTSEARGRSTLEQLTETLRSANGPPAGNADVVQAGLDSGGTNDSGTSLETRRLVKLAGGAMGVEAAQTPVIVPGAQAAIDSGLNSLSQIGNYLDGAGVFAKDLPLVGISLGDLVQAGSTITNSIKSQISSLWASLPTESDVTDAIQSWNNTVVAGITITVNSVAGHYGATDSDPFWWDIDLDLSPAPVNQALQNISGALLDAAFSSAPSVQVESKLNLDFGFGYDSGFFLKLDHLTAEASVNVGGLSGFPFNLAPPGGPLSLTVSNGSVNLTASLSATPDDSILSPNALTGPRISAATLSTVAGSATNVADAFNFAKSGSLDALFALNGVLIGYAVNFSGTHTIHIHTDNLFEDTEPDLTMVVNGSIQALNQTITGTFTLKKTATETVLETANATLDLNLGAGGFQKRVLRAENGTGAFLLIGEDFAGTASLTITQGPDIPNLSLSHTEVNLAVNTSGDSIATIDGGTVNLPAGPYYRVSGHAAVSLTTPQANLTADAVFEPRDTDSNPANGNEEVVVGVANLAFNLGDGSETLLEVSNGSGAFVISPTGITGVAVAEAALSVPALDLTGAFTVLLNDTNASFAARVIEVNGAAVSIPALPSGPYLRVSATGAVAGQPAQLSVLGIMLSGDFVFERKTTNHGNQVVTVAAANVSFNLGSLTSNLINVTNGSGVFIVTADGMAGQGSVEVALGVPNLGLSGSFSIRLNNNANAIDETVDVSGSNQHIDLPAGPYLQVNGTGVTLTAFGIAMTGDYSFEQHQTAEGVQLITVQANNVSFDFGTSVIEANHGQALFLITDSGMAGQGSIDVGVQAFGAGFNQPFDWSFNNLTVPVDDSVNTGPAPAAFIPAPGSSVFSNGFALAGPSPPPGLESLSLPGGPFNRLSSHGPITISVNVAGQTEAITGALVVTLVHPESGSDYVTVGVSDLSMTLGAGAVTLGVSGGTGAFVIYPATPSKLAGEVTVASATLNGASAVSIDAKDLKLELNNTGADVGTLDSHGVLQPIVVSISDNSADNVSIKFEGDYYHDYLAAAGSANIVLTGFVTLGGNFAFELSDSDSNQLKAAVTDLHFDLKAGSLTIASFNNGSGAFLIGSGGLAGVASLQFESGIIGISGAISLEANTTSSPVNTSITTASGVTAIHLADTNYLRVGVQGYLHLGSAALPFNFNVSVNTGTGEVEFRQQGTNTLLVAISPTGEITTGLSFSDFAKPDAFGFVSMLRQLGDWIDSFRSASIFNIEIPFTGGKTLGDAFDWSQLFLDKLYSHVVSVELESSRIRATDPVTHAPLTVSGNLVNAQFQIQLNDETPILVTVNGAYADFNALLALLSSALPAALSARIEVRKNKDDQLVIALKDAEIAAGTSLNLVAADSQINDLGFGPGDNDPSTVDQVGILTARYSTEDFFAQLASVLLGPAVSYNAAQQVYTYNVNISDSYSQSVPFSFNQDFGPIASAQLDGKLTLTGTVGFNLTLGFDLSAREVPRLLSSSLVPVPANGQISDNAHFQIYINDDLSPLTLTLSKSDTNGNGSISDLATDLNNLFGTVTYTGLGSPIELDQLIIAQAAGTGLAISARDTQLGIVNHLAVVSPKNDPFATELGFGVQLSPDGQYFLTASNSTIKGLFIDHASLSGSLAITTDTSYNANGISGSLKFGFVEIQAQSGRFGTLDYEGNPAPLTASLSLENRTTGSTRLYLSDLMNGTSSNNIANMVNGPNLAGSFLAELDDITVGGLGFSFPIGSNPKIGVWIPDIKNLNYNAEPYDPATNNEGLFLAYPDIGYLQNFTSLSFTQIIQALQAISTSLSQLSAFSFLDDRLPLIDLSINDMIDYASKFAELIGSAANGGSQSLQDTITNLKTQVDHVLNLDPDVLTISLDTSASVALKFDLKYSATYANSLPFALDLKKLVAELGGTNAAVASLLQAATTLIQVQGSGNLTVSASAALTLDFGLDLSDPSTVRPFFYDTTGVVLTAKVLGTNINIQASLGAVAGIWIKNGSLTLDADGNPNTGPASGDKGATFRLGLRDNNGDGRHYFDEDWFNLDNIDLHLKGGATATLPIFAPFESSPLGGLDDTNHDGYPDNDLVVDIPDLVRLFTETQAVSGVAEVRIPGPNNDFSITRTSSDTDNFTVVFQQNAGVGNSATAGFSSNTLTVQINSGSTTAAAVQSAIQNLGQFTVAFLPNDPTGPNTGTGVVTVAKLILVAPDFSKLFDNLQLCDLIASETGPLLDGLDKLLGSIQDGLNAVVLNTRLPLIGDGLAGAANFIQDFRSGLLKELRDEVKAAGGNGLTAIENAIKKAFWNSLGPGGLDLLVNPNTHSAFDPAQGYSQLDVKLDCQKGLVVNLELKKEIALVDTSGNPIQFDIGVPGFGLAVDGNVNVSVGFDLKFGFGVSPEDGFYFNSSAPASDPELTLFFRVTIPSLHFSGQLLFLQLDVADNADAPSLFDGHFAVDLRDPNNDGKLTWAEMTSSGTKFSDILKAQLAADARVNLDLAASFGGNTAFPRVLAQFHLTWHFDIVNGAGSPQISFNNVELDLGTFISDFMGPVLKQIQKVTQPIQPIIDLVQARIPILSDLAGQTITLLDLAQFFGLLEPSTVDFISDVAQVITLINKLDGLGEGTILIPFGSFSLSPDSSGQMKTLSVLENLSSINLGQAISSASGPGVSSTYQSAAAGFAGDIGSLHNFSIPIFDHPSELFNLFIGKPVRLVEWRMPTFKFEFTYTQKIPIYPPLYAQFGGSIGAEINFGFGYDTFGIQEFISDPNKNPADLLDGFYILTQDASGKDLPALKLTGEIFAGASVDLVIVEVGVRGGVSATVQFLWNDNSDNDGKMRVNEIAANAQQDPRCIFNIDGELSLFLEAYLKINLFFFSIDKTWRFAEITLVSFDVHCPEPVLGEMSGSTLTLNAGSRASLREYVDTADNSETFVVRHVDGTAGNETVDVTWSNHKKTFTGVDKIVVLDAGQGDDVLDFRTVLSPVEANGGVGNDTIYLSDGANSLADGGPGNDTIIASSAATATGVVLQGGDGNDTITAGTVAITIHGNGDNDSITGSPEGDSLYGDNGDDTIVAGDGDDFVDGGDGNDTIEADAGSDFVFGGAGDDLIRGNRDDDVIDGGDGSDQVFGGAGNDLLIGGNGNDKIYAHGGTDLLIGDQVGTVNNLNITQANLGPIKTALAAIPSSGITAKGLTGSGNDFLVGGGGSDVIFGGDGDDFLYGGNLAANGDTEVIEEDGNDFIDGGRGNDTIFGDDSMGRTGDRDTGIAIKSSIWYDLNLNGKRDSDETGFGGVTVQLFTASNPPGIGSPIATEKTDVDGAFAFLGLDPNNYILVFSLPTGLDFTARTTTNVGQASDDNDADPNAGPTLGQTNIFNVTYDQTFTAVSAGYTGPAKVSITDSSVAEGNTGQAQLVFNVTLSGPQAAPVQVEYTIVDGTATASSGDYVPMNGTRTLQFDPGQTSKQISVLVNGDSMFEPDEQFQLQIVRSQRMDSGGPFNLTLSQPVILGTIINDDPVPTIAIQDYNPTPDETEGTPATFIVTLSNPSQYPVSVDWRTDSALTFQGLPATDAAVPSPLPNADFTPGNGTITFEPGVTNQVVTVATLDDALDEDTEKFWVDLFNPTYAGISDSRGFGIIRDNDGPVSVSIAPVTPIGGLFQTEVTEDHTSPVFVNLDVQLSAPSGKVVTVTFATSPGTAVEAVYSGSADLPDYVGIPNPDMPDASNQLVFEPGGPLSQTITVQVNPDNRVEGDRTFFVNLLSADNAIIAATPASEGNHVTVVIKDADTVANVDYGPWSVRFSDANYTVQEPVSGTATANITLVRTPGSSQAVVVFYTTDGTATGGLDYAPVFRQLVRFDSDELTKTIPITIYSDNIVEGDETVLLSLRNPTGGPVRAQPDTATLTIKDGNTPAIYIVPPVFSLIPNLSFGMWEGSSGANTAHNFYVYLKDPATNATSVAGPGGVTIHYQTVNLTAIAGQDYTAAQGSVTIPAGSSSASIPIQVFGDTIAELNETFAVRIATPVGATLEPKDSVAIATIFDDDLTPISGNIFYDNNGNGFKDLNEKGIKSVTVDVSYTSGVTPVTNTVPTDANGNYTTQVLLGQVSLKVHGDTVKSPYNGYILLGSGSYQTTTNNESQVIKFEGNIGLPAFGGVGYQINSTFSVVPDSNKDTGRGGTDDTIFGGPGNDTIDAGGGDDHVVGGHWMTATDNNVPINQGSYDAVVTATTTALHPVYDSGPIFSVDTSSLNTGGSIKGQVWLDANNNGQQDAGELFTGQDVVVTLFDCDGNPVNALVTNTGSYSFTGIYLQASSSEYVVQFDLPKGYTFVSPVPAPPSVNSDVVVGGRTSIVTLSTGSPSVTDLDAGIRLADVQPVPGPGKFEFGDSAFSVSESVKEGLITITVVRGDSFDPRPVVVRTEDGTAVQGINYTRVSILLYFGVGETVKTVDVPIIDTDSLGFCTDPLVFHLSLRDPTGRPLDQAEVYIGGDSFGANTDDDSIQGGDDWDILIGDSGNIPAPTVIDPNPPYNNLGAIVYSGGPGKDIVNGGNGPDFINGQLGNDTLAGNAGQDIVKADLGNDIVYAELDDDVIDGGYGFDTVISNRDVPIVELTTTSPTTATLVHKTSAGAPLSTFSLSSIEMAQLLGGPRDNTFNLTSWNGSAFIAGDGGNDTLLVTNDADMILDDATPIEGLFFYLLYGFFKDSALSLPNGSTYQLGSLENVSLTGGPGDNTLDASGYSRSVTFAGLRGDDTLIGGAGDDTFRFDADTPLGADTVIGNGGRDTLDFSSTTTDVTVNLGTTAPTSQTVNPDLSLKLVDPIENATGGAGNDTLTGNALDNVLIGGPGIDVLAGGPGSETYVFDTDTPQGNKTIIENIADPGFDTLDFSGTATFPIELNMSIVGSPQVVNPNLTITLIGEGIEQVIGGALDDVIRGNSNNNTLRGGLGSDLLDGKSGDDLLDGGYGSNDLIGGLGVDTIDEQGDTNFTLTDTSLSRGTGQTETLDSIEVVNLTGGPGLNTFNLTGFTGTGQINGGDSPTQPRADTIIAAANADFHLTDSALAISINFAPITLTGIDVAILSAGPDGHTLDAAGFSGITTLNGSPANDVLIGGSGRDTLNGGPGDDILTGGPGNDSVDGGTGNNQLVETRDAFMFVLKNNNFLTALTSAPGNVEFDVLANIQTAVINGGPGNNTFDVSGWTAGNLAVNGAGGLDTVQAQAATNGDSITLSDAAISFTGGSAAISLVSIERAFLNGSSGNDTLDASAFSGDAYLAGGDGNDTLIPGSGQYLIDGGIGNDRVVFRPFGSIHTVYVSGNDGVDTLDFSAFVTPVTVDLSSTGALQTVAPGQLQLFLLSADVEAIIGSPGADTLTGNSLDNTFSGGGGADTIDGQSGVNTIIASADADFVLTNSSLTIGGVVSSLNHIQAAQLTGGPGDNSIDASAFTSSTILDGGEGNDTLVGGAGNDILIGGSGNDTLRGNAGNDVYQFNADQPSGEDIIYESPGGANGIDTLDFSATQNAGVTVDLASTGQQTVQSANLKLTLINSDSVENIVGTDQTDHLLGNALDNGFTGGHGGDVIDGRAGANRLSEIRDADFILTDTSLAIADASGTETKTLANIQRVILAGGAGDNLMNASAFTAGSVLLYGMDGNDTLYGGYGNDFLVGGSGNDSIYGGAGSDILAGEDGDDVLQGAGAFNPSLGTDGNDQLFGGKGNDSYLFDLSSTLTHPGIPLGTDTVTENLGEGYQDTLVGIGPSGIAVNLFSGAPQNYYDLNSALILTLVLANPGQVEFSF